MPKQPAGDTGKSRKGKDFLKVFNSGGGWTIQLLVLLPASQYYFKRLYLTIINCFISQIYQKMNNLVQGQSPMMQKKNLSFVKLQG